MKIVSSITNLRYYVISLSKAKNVVRFQGFRYHNDSEAVRNNKGFTDFFFFFFTELLEPLTINDLLWE